MLITGQFARKHDVPTSPTAGEEARNLLLRLQSCLWATHAREDAGSALSRLHGPLRH
jgi:hypothetical protein